MTEPPPDVRWQALLVGVASNAQGGDPGFAQSLNSQAEFARALERNMPGLGDDDLIVLPEPRYAHEVTDAIGLLNDETAEWAQARADRAELVELLRAEGLLGADSGDREDHIVVAMHELLARTPCRLVLASPYDVVGEVRQPNLPGTVDQYPNWRLPLPVPLEQLQRDPRVERVVAALQRPDFVLFATASEASDVAVLLSALRDSLHSA